MQTEILTWVELRDRLGGRRAAERAIAAGTWHRILRGVYASAPAIDLSARASAAQRLLPPRAYLADRSCLWLYGIDVLPRGSPALEVVVAPGEVIPRRAGVRARQAMLPPGDRLLVGGLRCLRLARATVDLLRLLPLEEAVVVADAVRHVGLVSPEDFTVELSRHARLRGVRRAARAWELSSPFAESPPESRLRLLLVLGGLAPIPQYDVRASDGRWIARVDLAFPAARLALEYDGRAVHERSDVFVRDRRRQNELIAAGWVVLRYTASDLSRPDLVLAQVRAALLRAAA